MISQDFILKLKQQLALTLSQQILPSLWGPVVVAGGHQFRSLWVRDFCFSVPGLLIIEKDAEVLSCLRLVYNQRDLSQKLLVRGLDVLRPQWRVLAATVGISLPDFSSSRSQKIIREFLGEYQTPAFDSNLLWILASLQYCEKHPEAQTEFLPKWQELLSFYDQHLKNNLIKQPAFSDWQDSARREGQTFYLNLLYLKVLGELSLKGLIDAKLVLKTKKQIYETFFDFKCGLFLSEPARSRSQFSQEALLWAVEWNLFAEWISQEKLYQNLKAVFYSTHRGVPVNEVYPDEQISWTTKTAGLRHYHDQMIWSWLWAEQIRIALLMKDKTLAQEMLAEFWAQNPDVHPGVHFKVAEIYQIKNGAFGPAKTWLYRSEEPFAWGLAKWVQALSNFDSP